MKNTTGQLAEKHIFPSAKRNFAGKFLQTWLLVMSGIHYFLGCSTTFLQRPAYEGKHVFAKMFLRATSRIPQNDSRSPLSSDQQPPSLLPPLLLLPLLPLLLVPLVLSSSCVSSFPRPPPLVPFEWRRCVMMPGSGGLTRTTRSRWWRYLVEACARGRQGRWHGVDCLFCWVLRVSGNISGGRNGSAEVVLIRR